MRSTDGIGPVAAAGRARHAKAVVIGAGGAGARHVAALASLGGLAGVYDVEPERARRLAETHQAHTFESLEAAFAGAHAAVIAAPALAHASIAERALAAGLHVLVEKPLAATVTDAERLLATAHRRGLVLQTGHHERLWIEALGLYRTVDPPAAVRCLHVSPGSLGRDVSVTFDLMIQDLDIVSSLFGASPLDVAAHGDGRIGRSADRMFARLSFAGGEADFYADRAGAPARRSIELVYADGAEATIDLLNGAVLGPAAGRLNTAGLSAVGDPLLASLDRFLAATRGSGASCAPGAAGAAAVRLAAAIDAAAQPAKRPLSALTISG